MPETLPHTQKRIDDLFDRLNDLSWHQIGYPTNQIFDYSPLYPLLQHSANNVGDPFHDSLYRVNTHEFEREVVTIFANLMRHSPDETWGYVTSGGTEGNMYGLYLAREMFPDGVVYFSQDTHYSVRKNLRVLNYRNIMIRSLDNGEIDYEDLRETIRINRHLPVVVMANIGTTMKGAVDDLDKIREIFDDLAISSSYIHVDAALSGMILPFVDDPQPFGFDAGIDSDRHQRTQDDRISPALRRGSDQERLRGTRRKIYRVCRRYGHHAIRFAQRSHAIDALVRV